MTEAPHRPHIQDIGRHIGEVVLAIPGLKPTYTRMVERFDPERRVRAVNGDREQVEGNIDHMLPDIADQLLKRDGLHALIPEVRSGRKKAVYKIGMGSLGIIIFASAAYEVVVRDGEDLKHLINKLDHWVHTPHTPLPEHPSEQDKRNHVTMGALKKRALSIFGHHNTSDE